MFLEGTERTIPRVRAETPYSCLMIKTQRFSSLFRHYAKYHGLKKDDLEYYFTSFLENEDTPESVNLQRYDVITVRKKRPAVLLEPAQDDEDFAHDMRILMDDSEHQDVFFLVDSRAGQGDDDGSGNAGGDDDDDAISLLRHRKRCQDDDEDEGDDDDAPPTVQSVVDMATDERAAFAERRTSKGDKKKIDPKLFVTKPFLGNKHLHSSSSSSSSSTSSSFSTAVDASSSLISSVPRESSSTSTNYIRIGAHKAILTARGEYFKGLFRKTDSGRSCWSSGAASDGTIVVPSCFDVQTVKRMLEFVYTNRVAGIKDCTAQELLDLLHLSDQWLLRDLKKLCEYRVMNLMHISNVAHMLCATERYDAKRLQKAAVKFVIDNLKEVLSDPSFLQQMGEFPQLLVPILRETAAKMPEKEPTQPSKKQKTDSVICDTGV